MYFGFVGIHFIIFKHLYKVPESTSLTNTYIYLEYATLNVTCNQIEILTQTTVLEPLERSETKRIETHTSSLAAAEVA
jgi:hypothetical protein